MVESKYAVGDVIGYGTRPWLAGVFVIRAIDNERYYLETVDGRKSVSPVRRFIESPGVSFRKVTKMDCLLYFRYGKFDFKFFLKICERLEKKASF